MGKKLLITEKPSVAMEFAKALKITTNRKNGYLESNEWIITWCVGHLVTMSYPDKYDEKLKFWRLDTLPFIPKEWKYEIIPNVQNQFNIIEQLMHREDIEEIYLSLIHIFLTTYFIQKELVRLPYEPLSLRPLHISGTVSIPH